MAENRPEHPPEGIYAANAFGSDRLRISCRTALRGALSRQNGQIRPEGTWGRVTILRAQSDREGESGRWCGAWLRIMVGCDTNTFAREEGNARSPPDVHYSKEPNKGKRLQVNRQSSSILSVKAKGRGTAGAKSPRSAEGETGKSELSPGAWTFIVPLYAWFDKVFVISAGCFWAQGCSATTTASPESL